MGVALENAAATTEETKAAREPAATVPPPPEEEDFTPDPPTAVVPREVEDAWWMMDGIEGPGRVLGGAHYERCVCVCAYVAIQQSDGIGGSSTPALALDCCKSATTCKVVLGSQTEVWLYSLDLITHVSFCSQKKD